MIVTHQLQELRRLVADATSNDRSVAVVPTMGALHDGHLSLARRARVECDVVVVTIFVNPTQFGPNEDYDQYPRTLSTDVEALEGLCDIVFAPAADVVYPPGFSTEVTPPAIGTRWEGECRPGHFTGVATVVLKLLMMVQAERAYFGEKDYQQLKVVQRMTADLDVACEIVGCETVRESDGLAMSSRNQYLSTSERTRALAISRALKIARDLVQEGEHRPEVVLARMQSELTAAKITNIDYVALVDPETLEPLDQLDRPVRALIAAYVGSTRLIDNSRIG